MPRQEVDQAARICTSRLTENLSRHTFQALGEKTGDTAERGEAAGGEGRLRFFQGAAMTHPQGFPQLYPTETWRNRTRASPLLVPVYRVGEPFHRGRRAWPEGAQFAFGPGGHELTLFHWEICEELVNAVRRGPAEFALIV